MSSFAKKCDKIKFPCKRELDLREEIESISPELGEVSGGGKIQIGIEFITKLYPDDSVTLLDE